MYMYTVHVHLITVKNYSENVSYSYKALTINVKAQLMERDAIYVQSLPHL